ncbi:Flp pilus assembly protein CpaB [Hyphobacterium sp. HN65]|uniref:Flp pilus assembly protein CpaB n=1 Tax=Hyphobacterium lacteum TaxID=3116575 RepID=A0ABU7LNL3_9PROT|nr:Flp pilus assembly protein CpaB [Hyphobacterium sp. HN65]MEE2525513.1 Flp pilus assembly protein CpaB [Hyphobacterium sp. HN65]
MNAARIIVLLAAGLAAAAAAFFVYRSSSNTPEPVIVEPQVVQAATVDVLAARRDLPVGSRIQASDLYWQAWPEDAVSPSQIVRDRRPDAAEEFAGSVVRNEISEGEPISPRFLLQVGEAGFMSAVLGPGMRGHAVPITAETGAGGFILPGDRVDVIVAYEAEEEGNNRRRYYVSETVVENARVLAIDQVFGGEEDSESVVVGETATLEVTPEQARALALATERGQISLSLRSLADTEGGPRLVSAQSDPRVARDDQEPVMPFRNDDGQVVVYRYGQGRVVSVDD